MKRYLLSFFSIALLSFTQITDVSEKPTLYIIGDSTVKNGGGRGADGLWGWGDFMYEHFDTTKIAIKNFARGGRSSRTFITEGLWDNVLAQVKPGDFVIMQFGHNDGGKINDDSRARGTIKGNGEETEEIDNMLTGKHEVVHSYGWYMRKYIADAKAKNATPIVCSLVARNIWKEGKVARGSNDYGKWAAEAAKDGGAFFIDLNELVASKYETIGQDTVTTKFFLKDHTHTTMAGAKVNAEAVVTGLKAIGDCKLTDFLK